MFQRAALAKEVGEAGEKTSAFEMVSPPRKQLIFEFICIAKNLYFSGLSPQAKTFRKQIEQQPNDVRTEFRGCSLKQKNFLCPIF